MLDRAASACGRLPGQIDIHTGQVATSPSAVRYLSHFPYAQKAWNGEGFDFNQGREYWLVDVSGLQHGITADRLGGGGAGNDIKGMLFGMTQRNSATAPALWHLWDSFQIEQCEMRGWWEDDAPAYATPTLPSLCKPSDFGITAFSKFEDRTLLVIASFCGTDAQVNVHVNWSALGLVKTVQATAPDIQGVQASRTIQLAALTLKADSGVIVVLK